MLETVFHSQAMEFLPTRPEAIEPAGPPRAKSGLHLMVVDADPAVRSACAEIAAALGHTVLASADLSQARVLLRGQTADMLLVNLPGDSAHGLDLVSEVKLLH